jgi:molybdenum cofactor guanylyltransferase
MSEELGSRERASSPTRRPADVGTRRVRGSRDRITAVILAGGRAQRMGGTDKGLLELHGKPLVEHIVHALRPQVGAVLINANRNLDRYGELGFPVLPDILGNFYGPLVGMATGLQACETELLLTLPCDSPLVPPDLAAGLLEALDRQCAQISVAHDGERMQAVFAILHHSLLPSMLAYLLHGGRRVDTWYAKHRVALANFSHCTDAFLNLNYPKDREALERTRCSED